MLDGLFPNMLSGFFFFILGLAIPLIRVKYRNSTQKGIFKLNQSIYNEQIDALIYTSNPGIGPSEELCNYVYAQEYIAVGTISEKLKKIYKNTINLEYHMTPETIQEVKDVDLCKNLILIGGPVDNCISESILQHNKVKPYFEFRDHTLYFKQNNQNWDSVSFQDNSEVFFEKDYSLIINIKNPKDSGKRIIMSCGCRSLGTLGGIEYLCNAKDPIPYEEYALIISCHGNKEYLSDNPKVIKKVDLNNTRWNK